MVRAALIGMIMILLLPLSSVKAQASDPDYEEIMVFLRVEKIGGFDITGIFSYTTNQFYLPATELFTLLHINQETHPGYDSITGFFIDEAKHYTIDYPNRRIKIGNSVYNFQPEDMLKTETGLYLQTALYGRAFGLYCTFSFRSLSVELKTDIELPAIRELRLQQMRQNVERLRGEIKVDTTIDRQYHFFRFGMLDWSVNSTQSTGETTDTRILAGIGSEFLWGETNLTLNYSTRDGFSERNQQYYWRWADNYKKLFKQIRVGKISPGTVASVYNPVLGAVATNAPTTYRRSFGAYTLTDITEPGWSVELYINNVIVDYTVADASGFYSFDIPLVYGNSEVTLKFYGPYGEERTKEQLINIPFNFLPKGETEYSVSAGVVQDSSHSIVSRGEMGYGINRFVTVGGGVEYLSSIPDKSEIPFLKASFTPHPMLLISGEYNHGVVTKGKFSFRNKANVLVEMDYANYVKDQKAIRFNYREERKLTIAAPFNYPLFKGFTRIALKQNVYEALTYNTAELTLSSFWGPLNANITGFANWIDGTTPYISANLAAGLRLGRGFNIRSQAQFDVNNSDFISYRIEGEKRISRNGYLSLNFEENLRTSTSSVDVSFRYDLLFAQTNVSNRYGNKILTTSQGARGSLAFGGGNGYIHAENRSAVGRGGIIFIPFLDINHNGLKDNGEQLVDGLNARVNGGRTLTKTSDTLIRVIELEPYTSYLVELDNTGFENIAWQVRHKAMSVYIDPNQFKSVTIPVLPMGEVNGMVYVTKNKTTRGIGRILINIYREDSTLVKKLMSETDGYFTFLGLAPGKYFAKPDPGQMIKINYLPSPEHIWFDVETSSWGDIIEGIDFVLTPLTTGMFEPDLQPTDNSSEETTENTAPSEPDKGEIVEEPSAEKTETPEEKKLNNIPEQPVVSEPSKPALDINAGRYFVQAGAFPNEKMALERKEKIDSAFNYPTGIIIEDGYYKLRLGYFAIKADAQSCYNKLIENNFEAFIGIKKNYR